MPRPDSMRPTPAAEKVPCTTKRGFAHHWKDILGEDGERIVVDGEFKMRCRYCRKHRKYPVGLKTWETWAGTVVIPNDTRFKRSYPDATSDFY